MGPFDGSTRGSSEDMFDYDGDGSLNLKEEAMMYDYQEHEDSMISGNFDSSDDFGADF